MLPARLLPTGLGVASGVQRLTASPASEPMTYQAAKQRLRSPLNSTMLEFMNKQSVVQALAALAHPVRLDAFRALVVAGREGLAQKALAEAIGVGPTNLAFHLKELATAGLVRQAQAGRFVIYRAAYEQMNGLLAYLTDNCCQGLPQAEVTTSDACGC